MLEIGDGIRIPDHELEWSLVSSGGPGGQNVNKVASKAVLRWRLAGNRTLPEEVKARLNTLQRNRITADGDLLIQSQRFRDQERNRRDCIDKLREMICQAASRPRRRKKTRPTRAARETRLQHKRRRARVKAGRQRPMED